METSNIIIFISYLLITLIVLCFWWWASRRQSSVNLQEVGSASLTDELCGAAAPFHIIINNSGGNQTFTVTIENTGLFCRIDVTWKLLPDDPNNPQNKHTYVTIAEKETTGSGTFLVSNGKTIQLWWECKIAGECDKCEGTIVVYQHT